MKRENFPIRHLAGPAAATFLVSAFLLGEARRPATEGMTVNPRVTLPSEEAPTTWSQPQPAEPDNSGEPTTTNTLNHNQTRNAPSTTVTTVRRPDVAAQPRPTTLETTQPPTSLHFEVTSSTMAVSETTSTVLTPTTTEQDPTTTLAPTTTKPRRHTYTEIQQFAADSFVNYYDASGIGPRSPIGNVVQVDCLAIGPEAAAPSAHGRWYHIAAPENYANYYIAANTFENGDTSGPLEQQPAVDPQVPFC